MGTDRSMAPEAAETVDRIRRDFTEITGYTASEAAAFEAWALLRLACMRREKLDATANYLISFAEIRLAAN